ncbi:MAG TPA: class I SAM-dependent methyltransferase [Candidatus Peribacterales bacterium]|nr:class I SAM-dependent methyltransferase [Candidatus Peribacterales bacterium]
MSQSRPTIHLGESNERLYLRDHTFQMPNGEQVIAHKFEGDASVIDRHIGRYQFGIPQIQNGDTVGDFPCGSGYASDVLPPGITYEGFDIDPYTLEYARQMYGSTNRKFSLGDLRAPNLESGKYNVFFCVEGIEHIERKFHQSLVEALHESLVFEGVLIITSPEAKVTGPAEHNEYHLCEYALPDFRTLLENVFVPGGGNVEITTTRRVKMTTGNFTRMLLATCHRGAKN